VILLTGLLTLIEHTDRVALGLDTALFHRSMIAGGGVYPGRMSPATALGFLLLGSSLLALEAGRRWPFLFQGCTLLSTLNGLIAVAGYIYGVHSLYGVAAFSSMALHTAALFVVAGLASVAARPQAGLMRAVSSEHLGGLMARRVLPLVLVLPIVIGWIRWKAQVAGYYGTEFGVAVFALSNVVMFSVLLWVSARWLNRADAERRHMAEEVVRGEERFQTMVNGIPQLAWMANPDGHIFWYNRRWYEYTGTTFEQMEGGGWQSVHDPAVLPKVIEKWKQSIARGERFDMEFPLRGADGHFRTFLTRIVPLRNSEGRIVRWFGTNTDISERQEAEEKLSQQAEELSHQARELRLSREALAAQSRTLQSVLDSIADGLIATDAQGNFVLWNPAADRILGQGKADVPPSEWAQHYRVYLPDRTILYPAEELPLARALRGLQVESEMFVQREDGAGGAWIEASAQPLRDENKTLCGAVVAFRDITRRVLSDRAIRELNSKLEQRVTERTAELIALNQELEAFSYSVSHDLRAPLRHISGFVRILQEDFAAALDPVAQSYVRRIEAGAQNMTRLVDEMLNLSRLGRQALNFKPTALNDLVDEVISLLDPEIAGRQVEWKIAALSPAECDPTLMKQVFQNLISNALKYSRPRLETVIEIGEMPGDGMRTIFVRDNGVGFDMKYADKLFGVFQRLHKGEEFEGTGVGLATAARIVQKHGGRIWAEAEKDCGATFYFTLAVAAPREKSAAAGQE
jgi:hypothetical protein